METKTFEKKQKKIADLKNELIAWLNDECPSVAPPLEPYDNSDLSHNFCEHLRIRLDELSALRAEQGEKGETAKVTGNPNRETIKDLLSVIWWLGIKWRFQGGLSFKDSSKDDGSSTDPDKMTVKDVIDTIEHMVHQQEIPVEQSGILSADVKIFDNEKGDISIEADGDIVGVIKSKFPAEFFEGLFQFEGKELPEEELRKNTEGRLHNIADPDYPIV